MEIISISPDNSFSEKGKEILSSIGKVRENIETELSDTTVLIIGLKTVFFFNKLWTSLKVARLKPMY